MAAHRLLTVLLATLGFATLGFAIAPPTARADDPPPLPEPIHRPVAEILAGLDRPEDDKGWLSVHLDRMNLHGKYGLTYSHQFDGAGTRVRFTVRGPVLAKPLSNKNRRVGLSFEIHF